MVSDSNRSKEVDALIEQIRQIAWVHHGLPRDRHPDGTADMMEPSSEVIDGYVAELARRSNPRAELPARFRHFPLTLAPVRYVALALYNLMTRDHRVTNVVVREAIQALQRRNEASSREVAVLLDCVRALLLRSWSDDSAVPAATPPGNGGRDEYASEMDSFFAALGDQFRGSSELTRDRLRIYLPKIHAAAVQGPALDLGCGRGEWLELLSEAKIDALGVEQNRALTAACRAKNLRIVEADFMAFLEQSPPEHWGLVTGFHIIEHLRWPAWYDCLRQIHRALVTGGTAILETPNPGNLITAASRFYLDPTHTHPIPDALLAFAVKSVGFSIVEILPLHPVVGSEAVDVASSMLPLLSGPQDYAIIVRK